MFADYQPYIDCQKQVSHAYRDHETWLHKAIFNTARSGYFSVDRTLREYAQDVWPVQPVAVSWNDASVQYPVKARLAVQRE